MSNDRRCRRCAGELSPETAVPLWDGNLYCERCVESQMPGLADYARSHPQLEESPPKEALRTLPGLLRLWAFVFLFFTSVCAIALYPASGWQGVFWGVVIGTCLTVYILAFPLDFIGLYWPSHDEAPTVVVRQGMIAVSRPGYKQRGESGKYSLKDVQWRIGKAREDTLLARTVILNRRVVILQYRVKVWWFKITYKAACGWTDETRERWVAFLTLVGVPQGLKHPWLGR